MLGAIDLPYKPDDTKQSLSELVSSLYRLHARESYMDIIGPSLTKTTPRLAVLPVRTEAVVSVLPTLLSQREEAVNTQAHDGHLH